MSMNTRFGLPGLFADRRHRRGRVDRQIDAGKRRLVDTAGSTSPAETGRDGRR